MDQYREIPLTEIQWPDSIRDISATDIQDMARSIMASGLIEPIIVEEVALDRYNGIVGRLRYEGSLRAGKTTIVARVHSFSDDSERKVWQLVENLVRREMNPIGIGEGYSKLKEYYEKELGSESGRVNESIMESMRKEIAEVSGGETRARRTVEQYLEVAEFFPDSVKKLLKGVTRHVFGTRHALQLLRLKGDEQGMLKAARFTVDVKPTSGALKVFIDDYLKIRESASTPVKIALEDGEISMKHAAALSQAPEELQGPLLDMTKKGALKSSETKKVVSFAVGHGDRILELLETGKKSPEKVVAIAEGKTVLETGEQVKAFFRGKRGQAEVEEFPCIKCGTVFKVDWRKGEVLFADSSSRSPRRYGQK